MLRQFGEAAAVVLLAALAAGTVGCGDDDGDGTGPVDGGGSGDTGGRAGGGRGGNGFDGGADAGASVGECVDKTMTATAGAVESECLACVCERGPTRALACRETCWDLVTCYARACGAIDVTDMNAVAGCAFMHCEEFVGEITPATELIKIIGASCRDECIGKMTPPPDGGIDAGD